MELSAVAVASPQDRDGDGLSDFHEVHKYRTDPASADSDGDGVPDGDWFERREFTYVVRSVVQVMRPRRPVLLFTFSKPLMMASLKNKR